VETRKSKNCAPGVVAALTKILDKAPSKWPGDCSHKNSASSRTDVGAGVGGVVFMGGRSVSRFKLHLLS
jgi:hypothetical protein